MKQTCSKCGGPVRADSKSGVCRRTEACRKYNNKSYADDNRERISANSKSWYERNHTYAIDRQKEYRDANSLKIQEGRRRWNYRMSPEQYQAMFDAQRGKCKGCKCSDAPLHIDHDHDCCPDIPTCGNCNRGLLCDRCNRGIGFVYENPDTLRALADYLESWEKDRIQA